jgi:LuxR family maltose regulon positive regulatory protein
MPAGQTIARGSGIVVGVGGDLPIRLKVRNVVAPASSCQAIVLDGRVPPVRDELVTRRGLHGRLDAASRITQISAPAGSGKTSLVRSWLSESGWTDSAGWASVQRGDQDPAQFWILVVKALRDTSVGSKLVRPLTGVPDLDGWAIVERLVEDLSSLEEPLWLVIDDLHELRSSKALAQLQLLVIRTRPELRFVLVARRDVRLGLHRLRLEGGLTEIRAADLTFTIDEARALFCAAGIVLPEAALAALMARTEGWTGGLRLAALSMAAHPDPGVLAAEFSGVERTVAEYLLAEVLDQLAEPTRRLLLRASVCERFSGELADVLAGGTNGEEILRELEEAGAFVVALDARRCWFRCHRLLADLLQRELRCTEGTSAAELHIAAARWFAAHGHAAEAVRHAQQAEDWDLAVRLLTEHFLDFVLYGQVTTADGLLAQFPAEIAIRPEVVVLRAADELASGSLGVAERSLASAEQQLMSVPEDRRSRFQVNLTVMRLTLANRRGDLSVVVEEAQRLLASETTADAGMPWRCDELRAAALVSLGTAEMWTLRIADAERHLEEGTDLAHRIGRPWLEVSALSQRAWVMSFRSFKLAAEGFLRAIELAREHGWSAGTVAAPAYAGLGAIRAWQMRLEEAEALLEQADCGVWRDMEPTTGVVLYQARGMVELARGCDAKALAAFQAAERLAGMLVAAHPDSVPWRAHMVQVLLRLGEIEQAEGTLAGQDESGHGEIRNAIAELRLAQNDPQAAVAALAPVRTGTVPLANPGWLTHAHWLEAIARDALGDAAAAGRALELALDCGESDGLTLSFVVHPAPQLLVRHSQTLTSHAALIAETLSRLPGGGAPVTTAVPSPVELLTESETRILRYLPTNLPAPEIARNLCVSVHTVRTHMQHVYEKLGVHDRTRAVEQGRALGLLAPAFGRS